MRRSLIAIAGSALLVASLPLAAAAQDEEKTFYWVSHGFPTDPVWTYFLDGASTWAEDTGHNVNTSFHSGDVPLHQEAIAAAIAANADGIVTSSPQPGSLVELVEQAKAAGITIININTPDPSADFDAYLGTNNVAVGVRWAEYLVDNGYVEEGGFVWMPVEQLGQTYQVQETEGIASVFDPLGIEYDIQETTGDQAEIITRMSDYLLANRDKIDAMIGLGDLVTGSVARVWDQNGVPAGEIPVVGWGNSPETTQEILDGYVLAGMWQDPQMTSYLGLSLASAGSSGIPPGFNITVGALYEADTAQIYQDILTGAE